MKLSFMSFSTPSLSLEGMLDAALRYGYDGVEPRIDANHAHGIGLESADAMLGDARKMAEDKGVAICCIATSCMFSGIKDVREQLEHAKRAIELASKLGAPAIRIFGGMLPEGQTREACFARIVEALREIAPFAEAHGVWACMETHDHWCHPAQVADIMRAVNHPNVAVNWDFMHPLMNEGYTVEQSFQMLSPWIRYVHAHDGVRQDGKLTLRSVGEGVVDHGTALRLLKEAGYEGYISGEWIDWEPYEIHLPREAERLRALMR